MARPKTAPTDRRDMRVNLRVSPVEFATLQEKADKAGMPVSAFARAAVLNRRVASPAASSTADLETFRELQRIGVNLNQIAKSLNARREALPHSLVSVCSELEAILDRITGYGSKGHERRP